MIIPIESRANVPIYIKVTKHLLLIYTSVPGKEVMYSMNRYLKNITNVKNGKRRSLLIQYVIHHDHN